MSKSAFMVLFLLADETREYSQSKICEELNLSRQTINSTVLNPEKQGIIRLEALPDNQKEKLVVLTAKGRQIVDSDIMRSKTGFS